MRLIDADERVFRWKEAMFYMVKAKDGKHPISVEAIIKDLESAQTIEAEPIKHAHWIIDEGGDWAECSNCHEDEKIAVLAHKDFCPACGAIMDEESVVIHP